MSWRVALAIMLAMVVLSSCLPVGENLLVVNGRIVNYADLPRKSCELSVLDAGDRRVLYRVSVTDTIHVDHTIAPQSKDYVIRVECIGGGGFESAGVAVGDRPKSVIELGNIHIGERK